MKSLFHTKILFNQNGGVISQIAVFLFGILVGGILVGEIIRVQHVKAKISTPVVISHQSTGTGEVKHRIGEIRHHNNCNKISPVVNSTSKIVPAVVSITVTQIQIVRDPYFDDFFGGFFTPRYRTRYREVSAIGSGVIFDTLGHILTNHHVVENAKDIFVNLQDGRQFKAEFTGSDPTTDIAIIKIRNRRLPYARLGNSDSLLLGETVIAIGNPFGYMVEDANPTVTSGIISALHRDFRPDINESALTYRDMIQTDATINPGNSGGPLVDIYGNVIGINSFIISPIKGSVGLGFAIPINKAKKVAKELIRFGHRRAYIIGIKVQELTPAIARGLGVSRKATGVVITHIEKRSPMYKANIKVGDVITKVNEKNIFSAEDIQMIFLDFFAGDKVYFTVVRGRKKIVVPILLKPATRRK